jgi:hypothetical protein
MRTAGSKRQKQEGTVCVHQASFNIPVCLIVEFDNSMTPPKNAPKSDGERVFIYHWHVDNIRFASTIVLY